MTATTFGFARPQVFTLNRDELSTIAAAKPHALAKRVVVAELKNLQSIKSPAL